MKTWPFVSVVVVSHNEEKNIRDCLSSLLLLDYNKQFYEIIVVDSSTDSTKQIISEYPGVVLIDSVSSHLGIKRNIGFEQSRGEYIAFTDADCIVPPNWLNILLEKFNDRVIAAAGGNAFPPPDCKRFGKYIACLGKPAGGAIGLDSAVEVYDDGTVSYLGTGNVIFKKNVLREVGGFNDELNRSEDVDICGRIRKAGYKLKFVSGSFVFHKTRDSVKGYLLWLCARAKAPTVVPVYQKSIFGLFFFIGILFLLVLVALHPVSFIVVFPLILTFLCTLLFTNLFPDMFPSGRKRFRLLFRRREKIGINLFEILFLVIPLAVLEWFLINILSFKSSKR